MIDRKQDLAAISNALSPKLADSLDSYLGPDSFAAGIGDHVISLFANVWARPGLSPRDRSLITVAMLIALRQTDELRGHSQLALGNGVTRAELEEVVLHASGYAGFPAALSAREAMAEALGG